MNIITVRKHAVQISVGCPTRRTVSHIARPGETISSHGYKQRLGGKGANQAVALSLACGDPARVSFYGTVGGDAAGSWVREQLVKWGLEGKNVAVDGGEPTGRAIIQVSDDGENSIVLLPGANHSQAAEQLNIPWPSGTTHVLLQNEIHMNSTLRALDVHSKNIVTIFNPSPMPNKEILTTFPWNKVDWLIVNELEARILCTSLVPDHGSEIDVERMLSALLERMKGTNIICTQGGNGVLAALPGHPIAHVPAAQLSGPVVDTTGAGDCFTGYFVSELMLLGRQEVGIAEVVRPLEVATRAAAVCVERPGTVDSMPKRDEVERRFGGSRVR